MGLGKTIQAIGACMLLKDLYKIKKVLVICPTSLKVEWEEQISKFWLITQMST
jgi:SNF2 family DNA or RNA helicase